MRKYRPVAKGGGALQAYREEMKERKRLRKRKMKTMVLKKVARQTKRLSQMYAVDFDSRVGPDDVQLLTKLDLNKEETAVRHAALWSLMEHSFHASCIPHLAKLFDSTEKGLNTAFLKINGSTVSCDGGILYRIFRGPAWTATTVVEVLYLATHPAHRRRGAAHAMLAKFEDLVTKIVDDLNEPDKIRLCVSVRGNPSAHAFWSKQNVKKLDKNDWLYGEMMLFGDYCPIGQSRCERAARQLSKNH